jgi:hypothetical protein
LVGKGRVEAFSELCCTGLARHLKRNKLHEQPSIEGLRLTVLRSSALSEINGVGSVGGLGMGHSCGLHSPNHG